MKLRTLIEQLTQEAAEAATPWARMVAAEGALHQYLQDPVLDPSVVSVGPHYARYLLHRDPLDRLCVMALVWMPGHFSPLHDHDGTWCVEGVVCGELDVQEYDARPLPDGKVHFTKTRLLQAPAGRVCSLFPPQEYHAVANRSPRPVVSIHVYGHELKNLRHFVPVTDRIYEPHPCTMDYDGALL